MHDSRRTRLVLSVLLIAALALITLDYRDGSSGPLRSLNSFGDTVFGPVETLAGRCHPARRADGRRGQGRTVGQREDLRHCSGRTPGCAPSSARPS